MSTIKTQFLLNQEITYLNHGSFGACPRSIFEDYQQWQLKLESEPVQFFIKTGVEALEHSKKALGTMINCDPDNLVFTTNPSYAINIIAKGINLEPGDEVLTTNLEYGAMDRTWDYYCKKNLAKYKKQKITLPITSTEQFIAEFWKGLTHHTKVVFISHITSATGIRLPVEQICEKAKKMGLITIVDGAHVPGHIPLDLDKLKADIYTGACHKWLLTPKGCSFLVVRKRLQSKFDPLLISWGYKSDKPGKSKFLDYHTYQGTRDFSAFLTIPKAIEFRNQHDWNKKTSDCRDKIKEIYPELCAMLGSAPICPVTDDFLVQMCSIPVQSNDPEGLKQTLYEKYKIEIPVFVQNDQVYIRVSYQPYNSIEDINHLKQALQELQKEGKFLN